MRDSRGAPEFVFNPRLGETYQEALDVKGNPSIDMDWYETKFKGTNEPYRYTVAHWCATEARFRNHLKKIKKEDAAKLIPLENMLVRITQQDVVYRRYLVPEPPLVRARLRRLHQGAGRRTATSSTASLSRQLVLFCVERRKAWRMLQSKAGIENRGVQGAASAAGRRRCREDLEGGFLRARRADVEGAAAALRPPHKPAAQPRVAAVRPDRKPKPRLRHARRTGSRWCLRITAPVMLDGIVPPWLSLHWSATFGASWTRHRATWKAETLSSHACRRSLRRIETAWRSLRMQRAVRSGSTT